MYMPSPELPCIKVTHEDVAVEYDFLIGNRQAFSASNSPQFDFSDAINCVDREIWAAQAKIDALNQKIEHYTVAADFYDNAVAVGSGLLAGMVDVFWVGEFDFSRGKAWSNHTVNDFVMRVAKANGYDGDRLDGAIKFLEDRFPIPSDSSWKGKDVGISARTHHLDDLAHHPTPIGLFFSILTQFTKTAHFQNDDGSFLSIGIDEKGQGLIGANIKAKIFCGAINWFFHLVSDMSGSNKTAGVGMGIPGPIVAMLKELAMVPGLNKMGLPKKLKEIFSQQRFDLRSELAVLHEIGRQAVPVILNEILVRAFYFLRRLTSELRLKGSFGDVDWGRVMPWGNRTIARMLTIATGTFTAVDLLDAAIRAGLKSGGNLAAFGKEFLLRVNFVGVGRVIVAVYADMSMGVKRERLREERIIILGEQLHWVNAAIAYRQGEAWQAAGQTERTLRDAEITTRQSFMAVALMWEGSAADLISAGELADDIEEQNPDLLIDVIRKLEGND